MRSRLSPSGMLRTDGPRRGLSSDIADLDRERRPVQVASGFAILDRRRAGVAMARSLGTISGGSNSVRVPIIDSAPNRGKVGRWPETRAHPVSRVTMPSALD